MYGKSERFEDYDRPARGVLAMKSNIVSNSTRVMPPFESGRLLIVERVAIQFRMIERFWVLGPGAALWLAPGAAGTFDSRGPSRVIVVFVPSGLAARFRSNSDRVLLTPLLHVLASSLSEIPSLDAPALRTRRISNLLIGEIRFVNVPAIVLPWPTDPRLKAICESFVADTTVDERLAETAARVGMSVRTIDRRFRSETGLSLTHWQLNARIVSAITEVAKGGSIHSAAVSSGFASASSLCTAFKRVTGTTLRQYFLPGANRRGFDEDAFFS
jgi:AraC-like DNA-binding protein